MPGFIQWASGSVQSIDLVLSGQGVQLTNGSAISASVDLDNTGVSGGPALYGVVELVASESGFGAAVNNNQAINLFMSPMRDGTNPATISTSGQSLNNFKGSFFTPVSGNVSRLSMILEAVPLMPYKYVTYLYNNTGQTLTSGWTLSISLNNQYYT